MKSSAAPRARSPGNASLLTVSAAAEAGALVGATLEHATGGVLIAFAEVPDEA